MTSRSNLYISSDFSLERTKNFTLLLQIRANDFSFAVVYQNELKAWGSNQLLSELSNPVELADYLSSDYHQVIIGIEPDVFTIVPKQLYKESIDIDLSRFLNTSNGEKVYKQTLDEENLIFFKYNDGLIDALTSYYRYHQLHFFYKGWINAIAANDTNWQNFYLDVQPDSLHLLYFKNNKLRYYNQFGYTEPQDLVYFVALAFNELRLSAVNTKLIISGQINEGDELMNSLGEFFPKMELSSLIQLSQVPAEVSPQHILSITALLSCAS